MISKTSISNFVLGMRGRLMLALILMAVLPTSVIGALAYDNARRTIEERVHAELNSVTDLKQAEINAWIELVRSDARLMADNFLTQDHITVILDDERDPLQQAAFANFLTQNLLSLQQTRAGYKELFVVDRLGTILLSTDPERVGQNVSSESAIQAVFIGPEQYHIEDIFLSGGEPEMVFGHQLFEVDTEAMRVLNRVNAALIIRVDPRENLFRFLQEWIGAGNSGELFLIKKLDSRFVFLSPLRFAENEPLALSLPEGLEFDSEPANGVIGVEEATDYRGVGVLHTYRSIPQMNWIFVTKQDQAEAFAPVTQLTNIWSSVTLVVLLVAIGVSALLARNLANPLNQLAQAAGRVGAGDFDTHVGMERRDEFGDLARAFDTMVAHVRSNAESLRKHSEELQSLVDLSDTLLTSLDTRETLQSALRQAVLATKADSGAVVLLSDEGDELVVEGTIGLSEAAVGMRLPYDALTGVGLAMRDRRPVMSANMEEETRFLAEPFAKDVPVGSNVSVPMLLDGRVLGALVLDSLSAHEFTEDEISVSQAIANQTALALERIKLISDLSESYDRTLSALVAALDARDKETEGHSKRVVTYTLALAEKMDIPQEMLQDLSRGALLHDIGKIGVPDGILHKPSKLDEAEWAIIKKHPEWGRHILDGIPFLELPSEIVLSHHERWDGKGYPAGLAQEEIPIGARIFAVADAFDAMTSYRPYRKAGTYAEARKEVLAGKGGQFDPVVVDTFLEFMEEDWARLRLQAMRGPGSGTGGLGQDMDRLRRSVTGQLGALNMIIAAITSSLDLKEVLANALEAVVHVTWATAAGIFFYDPDLDRLVAAADAGFPDGLKEGMAHVPVDEFVHGDVVRERTIVFGTDVGAVEGLDAFGISRERPNWLSYVCAPLTEGEHVVGMLMVFSEAPYVFDEDDVTLFERVGRQLGQAIANARTHDRARTQAITDGLTGAYNRHYLNDFLETEVSRCKRYQRPMALLMLDIDHFKACNDTAGHVAGDNALIDVVHLLKLGVRAVDKVVRFGGEEFVVVLPETGSQGALEAAERIRNLVNEHEFPCGRLTASMGVYSSSYTDGDMADPTELIARADEALLRAKQEGRNRVLVWEQSDEEGDG